MSTWIDAVQSSSYVHVDEDCGVMIVWNGSATFNVYTNLDNELNPADCFTRYACESGYGPGDAGMSWSQGRDWARRQIAHWLEDNVYGKPDSYYANLSREACVELLELAGIQCYDDEDAATLREAVRSNVADGTILTEDLP